MRRMTLFAVMLSLLVPTLAGAAIAPRLWIGGHGAWSTYAMSDVNDAIAAVNASLAGSGLSMDKIQNGFGFGAELGVDLPLGVELGGRYERLSAVTKVGNAFGELKFNLPANTFAAFGSYRFSGAGPVGVRLGAAVGAVSSDGRETLTEYGVGSTSVDVTGTGPMFEGFAGVDGPLVPMLGWYATAGYRYAKISEFKEDGVVAKKSDGSNASLDYSGLALRVGLRVSLTP